MTTPPEGSPLPLGELLAGAQLRRIDQPAPGLFALVLERPPGEASTEPDAGPRRGVLLVGLPAGLRGVGWVTARPKGAAASPFVQRLRRQLEGARLQRATRPEPAVLALALRRGVQQMVLEAQLHGHRGNLTLHVDGEPLASLHRKPRGSDGATPRRPTAAVQALRLPESWLELRSEGARLSTALDEAAFADDKRLLLSVLRQRIKLLERRRAAIEGDLARAGEADALRHKANLLVAQLHAVDEGKAAVEVLDTTREPPEPVTLRIDPALGARRQVDAWYKRARGLERAAQIARPRLTEARSTLDALHALHARTARAESYATLEGCARDASAWGVVAPRAAASPPDLPRAESRERAKRGRSDARLPYRVFTGSGGRPIWVGRSARDNDLLTTRHARPHDLWLHARDSAGSHVVVPLSKNEACPAELLIDAATLAAHFSQDRQADVNDILHVPRRYVRKPRGAPPGSVVTQREKVLRLRMEPERLARLLRSGQPLPDRQP